MIELLLKDPVLLVIKKAHNIAWAYKINSFFLIRLPQLLQQERLFCC